MRKLAAASGVGLGTIYDYFPSAKQIIHVLLIERLELRQDMLKATFTDVSREQGLAVFVPSYLKLLIGQGFWSEFDTQLHEAAKSDPELRALFEGQETQMSHQYVAEMKRAGSSWSDADLFQVARANMAVPQMVAELKLGAASTPDNASDMQITLSANMILANLKMVLRPPAKSGAPAALPSNSRSRTQKQ